MNKNILKTESQSSPRHLSSPQPPPLSRRETVIAGINEATSMVSSYFDPGTKLIYAIGAVVGLIGGVKVYGKFSSGDPDTSQDSRLVVRRVHLPDCRRHHPALILPLINNVWLNTQ